MPYKDKERDNQWHKMKMRERRAILKLNSRFVTPRVTPSNDVPWWDRVGVAVMDADGQPIPKI